MLGPTTASTVLSNGRQKLANDPPCHPHWTKNLPTRFPLKFYKFTPRRQQNQDPPVSPPPACLPPASPPPPSPSAPDSPSPVHPLPVEATVRLAETADTPRKRGSRCGALGCGSTRAKEGSECSEYSPSQRKTRRKKRQIRKPKRKTRTANSPIVVSP